MVGSFRNCLYSGCSEWLYHVWRSMHSFLWIIYFLMHIITYNHYVFKFISTTSKWFAGTYKRALWLNYELHLPVCGPMIVLTRWGNAWWERPFRQSVRIVCQTQFHAVSWCQNFKTALHDAWSLPSVGVRACRVDHLPMLYSLINLITLVTFVKASSSHGL